MQDDTLDVFLICLGFGIAIGNWWFKTAASEGLSWLEQWQPTKYHS